MPREIDPFALLVLGEADGPGEHGVDKKFGESEGPEGRNCPGRPPDPENIRPGPDDAVEGAIDARPLAGFRMGEFMQGDPDEQGGELGGDADRQSQPTLQNHADDRRQGGEIKQSDIKQRSAAQRIADPPTEASQQAQQLKEPGDDEQGADGHEIELQKWRHDEFRS